MQEYILLVILLVLFLAVIIFTRYLNKPVKSLFSIYYLALGTLFIVVKERIDNAEEGAAMTPNANWIVNNEWVADTRHLLFVPMIGLLIYLLYKGYQDPKGPWKRTNILGVTIPLAALLAVFYFLFTYVYGYHG
ncbi:hypothetical protein [Terribacillus sp. 7520-G]|uniref:hypothetical protein n=1 Tax=Terribacillus sp. 7520-G TaxID=2025389 RepID=UPI000BA5335C|nr:hypothetical protein [Terribacillus sp. 7520-G]PAD39791.1 hypothetical protein CHH53_04635 [Terribacillus sp. 7520-G]